MKTKLLFAIFCVSVGLGRTQELTGNPLAGLERLKPFESMRTSSSDPDWKNGNEDSRPIGPGETLVLAALEGPGVITHFWNTIAHSAPHYSQLLTLRIYWDGEKQPSVECPIGDFFGIGHGMDQSFVSLPIKVSSEGRGRNCYWPMPFRKSARVTVTNESERRCDAFYYYLDWQKHPSLPDDTAYFHAMYRQEYPCVMGRNYLLADLEGRGHYVGTIQSVLLSSSGWYGEGDDFFFIDGESEPRLRGTGTEDYFCDGWGFRQQDGPFYGTPLWQGYEAGCKSTAYRFHIPDPVTFKKSLRVEIEHKGSQQFPDGSGSGFIERDDLMSSVALWYQTEPHKPWPAIAKGPERIEERAEQVVTGWKAVSEARHSDAPLEVQALPGIAPEGKQLWFKPHDANAWVEVTFDTVQEVTGSLWGKLIQARDYGDYRVSLDGQQIAMVSLYNPEVKLQSFNWGHRALGKGRHTLRFECTGKSEKSTGYFLGVDAVSCVVPVYQRPPGFDLRKIQVK